MPKSHLPVEQLVQGTCQAYHAVKGQDEAALGILLCGRAVTPVPPALQILKAIVGIMEHCCLVRCLFPAPTPIFNSNQLQVQPRFSLLPGHLQKHTLYLMSICSPYKMQILQNHHVQKPCSPQEAAPRKQWTCGRIWASVG